jgi:excisionase family DNA binding protein
MAVKTMTKLEDCVTIQEAAELTGFSRTHVRRLVVAGRIEGLKVGRDWLVDRAALLAYSERAQALGRQKFNPWRADLAKRGRGRSKGHDAA